MGTRNASETARSPNSTGASNASANSTLAKQHAREQYDREQRAAHCAQPTPPVNRRDCTLYNKSLQLVQMAPPLDLPEPFL